MTLVYPTDSAVLTALTARFWSKVQKTETCWLWAAGKLPNGYGKFWISGVTESAHRVAYFLTYGPIPEGLFVCHDCPDGLDRPDCVNPAHLWLGTAKQNTHDMMNKGRNRNPGPTNPRRGERGTASRLTEEQVQQIREEYRPGNGVVLAARYNVTPSAICLIVKGRNWHHSVDNYIKPSPKGETHCNAKLTQVQVDQIRCDYQYGMASKMARQYGVSNVTILNIIHRKVWR